jgi:uncharacterized SAM-binding protein YcdF (DUF218 family)
MTSRMRVVRRSAIAAALLLVTAWPVSVAGSALVVQRQVLDPEVLIALGSHEWERLPAVARLARRWPRAAVILTEPVRATDHNCFRCGERIAWLASLGVQPNRVSILRKRVTNTHDEALALGAYRETHPLRRVVVVTSPYHTRRALAAFTAVLGERVVIGVQPATDYSPARPAAWWRASYDRGYVSYEWAALAWYGVRYGVNPLVSLLPVLYSVA